MLRATVDMWTHTMVLIPTRSSCVVYSERKSLRRKSRVSQLERQENVKSCQQVGKSASEMFRMMKRMYGEEALGCSAVEVAQAFCTGERQFGRQ
jgi:hypothetical protein